MGSKIFILNQGLYKGYNSVLPFFDRVINLQFFDKSGREAFVIRSDYEAIPLPLGGYKYKKLDSKPEISLSMEMVDDTSLSINLAVNNFYAKTKDGSTYFKFGELSRVRIFLGYATQCLPLEEVAYSDFPIEAFNNLQGYGDDARSSWSPNVGYSSFNAFNTFYDCDILFITQSGLPPERKTLFECTSGRVQSSALPGEGITYKKAIVKENPTDTKSEAVVKTKYKNYEHPTIKGFYELNVNTSISSTLCRSIFETFRYWAPKGKIGIKKVPTDFKMFVSMGILLSTFDKRFKDPRKSSASPIGISCVRQFNIEEEEDGGLEVRDRKKLLLLESTYGLNIRMLKDLMGKNIYFYIEGEDVDIKNDNDSDSLSISSKKVIDFINSSSSIGGLFGRAVDYVSDGVPVLPAIYDAIYSDGTIKIRCPYFPFVDMMKPIKFYTTFASYSNVASILYNVNNNKCEVVNPFTCKIKFSTYGDDNLMEMECTKEEV